MSAEATLYLLHALSPIHVGVDQGLGAIDLPMMRAVHTGDPLIPGSSVKGVLRQLAERERPGDVEAAFGPPQARAGDFQGGLVFGDAHVLALPVRSLCGGFAWVTCSRVLKRLARDLADAGLALPSSLKAGAIALGSGAVAHGSALLVPDSQQIFLEELLLDAAANDAVGELADTLGEWFWPRSFDSALDDNEEARADLKRRIVLVHDDLYGFYCRVGLEVRARVKIDDNTGTAAKSGPWTEEHLPTETLMFGIAFGRATSVKSKDDRTSEGAPRARADGIDALKRVVGRGKTLRIGGHATIGLGRARLRIVGGEP